MKRVFFLGLFLLLTPGFLYGAIDTATSGHTLLASFSTASEHWRETIIDTAQWMFWSLLVLDLLIEFGFLALNSQLSFDAIFTPLMRKVLMIGFFLMLFQHSDYLATIPASFSQLGDRAAGVPVDPDNIIAAALGIVGSLTDGLSAFHLADSIVLFFSALVILIAFGLMTAHLIMVYVKTYVFLAIAPLVFSLAGLNHTRQMAYNPIMAIIKAGMELFLLKIFLGLSITMMHDFAANIDNDNGSIFVMIIMSIVMASVVHMVSGIVEAVMSGTIAQNSTAGLGVAAGVAGGAVAGAAAAAKHGTGIASAAKAAKQAAANSGGSAMGHFARAMGNDMVDTIKGKNARNTTSGFSRAADAMKADTQSGGGSSRSSAGDGEISKGSK